MTKYYSFIGNDHPPGWRRIGSIDVADSDAVAAILDEGYRIGTMYDGGSGSLAEPRTADIYVEIDRDDLAQPGPGADRDGSEVKARHE